MPISLEKQILLVSTLTDLDELVPQILPNTKFLDSITIRLPSAQERRSLSGKWNQYS